MKESPCYKVETWFDKNGIIQDTWCEPYELMRDLQRRVIDLQNSEVRKALIALGWTPPK